MPGGEELSNLLGDYSLKKRKKRHVFFFTVAFMDKPAPDQPQSWAAAPAAIQLLDVCESFGVLEMICSRLWTPS